MVFILRQGLELYLISYLWVITVVILFFMGVEPVAIGLLLLLGTILLPIAYALNHRS